MRMGTATRRRATERFGLSTWLGDTAELLSPLDLPRRATTLVAPPGAIEAAGDAAAPQRHQTTGGSVSRSK